MLRIKRLVILTRMNSNYFTDFIAKMCSLMTRQLDNKRNIFQEEKICLDVLSTHGGVLTF